MRLFVLSQSPLVRDTTSCRSVTSPLKPSMTDAKYFDGGARTTISAPSTAFALSDSRASASGSATPFRNLSFRRVRRISSMYSGNAPQSVTSCP